MSIQLEAPLYEAEHTDYRESVRTFLTREAVPSYPQWRTEHAIPRALLDLALEHGFLGMRIPEEQGGVGVEDPRFGAIVGEEAMLSGVPALALTFVLHNDVALPALLRGGWSGDLAATVATVIAEGVSIAEDGTLAGTAEMVANGVGADVFLVIEGERIAAVAAPDVALRSSDPPVGLDALGLATVSCDGTAATLLEGGAEAVRVDLAFALASTALAGARAALKVTVDYVLDRKAFGQPIAAFQNTQRLLAGVQADIAVGDAYVERALRRLVAATLDVPTASAGKLFCTELYGRCVDAGVQLHGGYGYIMEYEIAHMFADARYWRVIGGTSQQMADAVAAPLFG